MTQGENESGDTASAIACAGKSPSVGTTIVAPQSQDKEVPAIPSLTARTLPQPQTTVHSTAASLHPSARPPSLDNDPHHYPLYGFQWRLLQGLTLEQTQSRMKGQFVRSVRLPEHGGAGSG